MFTEFAALVCLGWYIFIVLVCTIGCVQLARYYSNPPKKSFSSQKLLEDVPHVTAIRPCKGNEPYLYECLSATFQQDYPIAKLTVYLCIASRQDPAYPTLEKVVKDHPKHDAKILVEEEDPALIEDSRQSAKVGPNPKIRNMSRAYREAKGDIVWIIDCNVWVGKGVCGRMVDKLCGFTRNGTTRPYKLVHQLPISVDVDMSTDAQRTSQPSGAYDEAASAASFSNMDDELSHTDIAASQSHGGRLEELFLASSHAKMYVAISSVAIAPCIVGKSNMFRRSHLNYLTSSSPHAREQIEQQSPPSISQSTDIDHTTGIDHFSHNICEDHLIGDLLWRSKLPDSPGIGNHAIVLTDLAIQPVSGMTLRNYVARRVRWLRVRKFTVPVATLVEPGTESFLCSAYGAWGLTASRRTRNWAGTSWQSFFMWWLFSIAVWMAVDWAVYILLHSGRTIEAQIPAAKSSSTEIPDFAQRIPKHRLARRAFREWALAWLGREALALPIWTWAIWGGATVNWREKRFRVGMDMRVHEVGAKVKASSELKTRSLAEHGNGHVKRNIYRNDGKDRTD